MALWSEVTRTGTHTTTVTVRGKPRYLAPEVAEGRAPDAMAEGPNDGEGDGHGHTFDFVIRGNYCETLKASQALMFEDVQHVTVVGNTFAAATDHAVGPAIHSTGAHVRGNRTNPRVRYDVGIDASYGPGYRGPRPGGAP
ncbi:hypothetical protein [Streptomyces sp. NPDC048665]|uniref:hypothetical protein n=1 Tax=Streptomyces sp. NPDC048665 TaxID=3155490 RepID=UPI003431F74A